MDSMGGTAPMGGAGTAGDATGGTGGTGGGNVAGDLRCNEKQVEFFAGGELWVPLGSECEFLCVDGTCTGDCEPNSSECVSGLEARNCNAEGVWEAETCQFACVESDNACGGTCVPGTRQCADKQKQLCDEQGSWQNDGAACTDDCDDSGDGSSATCTSCVGDATQCLNNRQQQDCVGSQWGTTTNCEFSCVGDECGGECIPGTSTCTTNNARVICDSTGTPGAPAHCDGQSCVATGTGDARQSKCDGVCEPGQVRCDPDSGLAIQECEAGKWVTQTACNKVDEAFTCRPLDNGTGKTIPICGACTPGTPKAPVTQCHSTKTGNAVEQCTYDKESNSADWVVTSDCESNLCYNGACYKTISNVCAVAPKGTTVCADIDSYWSCPTTILVREPVSCKTSGSCVYGSCDEGRSTTF